MAQHYRELSENGRTRAEIASIVGVSRPRVTQYMNLLNLPSEIQKYLSDAKYELDMTLFTERKLRAIGTMEDKEKQVQAFRELLM